MKTIAIGQDQDVALLVRGPVPIPFELIGDGEASFVEATVCYRGVFWLRAEDGPVLEAHLGFRETEDDCILAFIAPADSEYDELMVAVMDPGATGDLLTARAALRTLRPQVSHSCVILSPMWITLNKGFFSIVANNHRPGELLVRARRAEDIVRIFTLPPQETPERDYPFRVSLPRKQVAEVIGAQVLAVDYGNFKDSIDDDVLHDACMRVWSDMRRIDARYR